MKQIVIISGKGGTGKTVITGALAALAENKIMVDCDVDAADLHLLLQPKIRQRHEFICGKTAVIDPGACTKCGQCLAACRFQAINGKYIVDPIDCEGCGLCARVCSSDAVKLVDNKAGEWFISDTRFGPFVHAKLGIAEENSGKLVSRIRQAARDIAKQRGSDYIIIDGPPGIGCPVIASLTGVDLALIVTEPTTSGLHDAKRIMDVARHFNVPVKLAVNKYDLNPEMTDEIENYCKKADVPVVGKIAFDRRFVEAMVAGKMIIEYDAQAAGEELSGIWQALKD
ncbi:MAG: ATP-binding protein [Candidatus Saganbacteria bacterium]|nr:ATP-binding protein [Candidatus Saganbacteria bacterium]